MKLVKLDGLNATQAAKLPQPEPARSKDAGAAAPVYGAPDTVNVSGRAGEVHHLIARAGELADIRHDRVHSLQQAIHAGRHMVSASDIAAAIIHDEGAWRFVSNGSSDASFA
jgi:flagellar biosynthesis anti-sigma factor FlgM